MLRGLWDVGGGWWAVGGLIGQHELGWGHCHEAARFPHGIQHGIRRRKPTTSSAAVHHLAPYALPFSPVHARHSLLIARRASLQSMNVALRPHLKTHKCRSVAARQLDAGAIGFTCAKPYEALQVCRWVREERAVQPDTSAWHSPLSLTLAYPWYHQSELATLLRVAHASGVGLNLTIDSDGGLAQIRGAIELADMQEREQGALVLAVQGEEEGGAGEGVGGAGGAVAGGEQGAVVVAGAVRGTTALPGVVTKPRSALSKLRNRKQREEERRQAEEAARRMRAGGVGGVGGVGGGASVYDVWIKVDVGLGRCGVLPEVVEGKGLACLVDTLTSYTACGEGGGGSGSFCGDREGSLGGGGQQRLRFRGILSHAGHSYGARDKNDAARVALEEAVLMRRMRDELQVSEGGVY